MNITLDRMSYLFYHVLAVCLWICLIMVIAFITYYREIAYVLPGIEAVFAIIFAHTQLDQMSMKQ